MHIKDIALNSKMQQNTQDLSKKTNMLNICNTKSKVNVETIKTKLKCSYPNKTLYIDYKPYNHNTINIAAESSEKKRERENQYINFVREPKHFPPANKEWVNSIYVYNNTTKDFSALDNNLNKLIRGYFNLYNHKLRVKVRKHKSKRFEIRKAKRLMNRILFSKPELKHSNDKVIITIYIYNSNKKYLINKIINRPAIYKLDKSFNEHKGLTYKNVYKSKKIFIKKTNKASINVKSKINNQKRSFFILGKDKSFKKVFTNIKTYEKHFVKSYIKKFLRREVVSVFYKQILAFNKSKFENKYILSLCNEIHKLYNKKVEFNFVNLKHLYLDNYIFSSALIIGLKKLAKRKKYFIKAVRKFLSMFKNFPINSLDIYNAMFNKKSISQNININNVMHKLAYDVSLDNITSKNINDLDINLLNNKPDKVKRDILDSTLRITRSTSNTDLKNKNLYTINSISTLTEAFKSTKYKIINGVRLEIAGRFTRRSSAARSVFKIRNKGSIKNKNSSIKHLPTALLKGYAKSNLQYNKLHSKVRGGSFGIRGWLSGV